LLAALADRLREEGSWTGETHLQKATYFLQELVGVPSDFRFVLYWHGPFSFDLRDELGAMRGEGFLELQRNPAPYGPTLAVSRSGQQLTKRADERIGRYRDQIDFISKLVGASNVARLERLSTALLVTKQLPSKSVEERARRLMALKPHISFDAASDAVEEMDEAIVAAESVRVPDASAVG
jgi:hypothetical protein